MKILGMGEWAPLPPHESSGTPPSLSSENAYGGGDVRCLGGMEKVVVGGGPIVLLFKV